MTHKAIVVFTAKSVERLLEEGGSSSWVLDRYNARAHEFIVCTRNAHADWTEGDEAHGSAFLIGRIGDVVPSPSDAGRWLVKFSEYTRVNLPDIWKGWRNPVRYTTLEELGIDLSSLDFETMPPPKPQQVREQIKEKDQSKERRLTIEEAKRGLSLTFGVSPDAIEIIIRG